jgi:hypothetical protein
MIDDDERGAVCGMKIGRGNRSTRRVSCLKVLRVSWYSPGGTEENTGETQLGERYLPDMHRIQVIYCAVLYCTALYSILLNSAILNICYT